MTDETLHASAVAFGPRGVLILGPSGAGKSGLALRLLALGADLVADDRVALRGEGADLRMHPPAALEGLIEARGVGILRLFWRGGVAPVLAVDLGRKTAARMPDPASITLNSLCIPLIAGKETPNLEHVIRVGVNHGERFSLYHGPEIGAKDDEKGHA